MTLNNQASWQQSSIPILSGLVTLRTSVHFKPKLVWVLEKITQFIIDGTDSIHYQRLVPIQMSFTPWSSDKRLWSISRSIYMKQSNVFTTPVAPVELVAEDAKANREAWREEGKCRVTLLRGISRRNSRGHLRGRIKGPVCSSLWTFFAN